LIPWSAFHRSNPQDPKLSEVGVRSGHEITLRLFQSGARQVLPQGASLRLPIYLDGQLQKRLERIAQKKGRDLGEVVSDLLTKDVELLEELK